MNRLLCVAFVATTVGLAAGALAQPQPPAEAPQLTPGPGWAAALRNLGVDFETIGVGNLTPADVPPDAPFGALDRALTIVLGPQANGVFDGRDIVGGILAAMPQDQLVETLQRCRIILDNIAPYSVETVAFCNAAFELGEVALENPIDARDNGIGEGPGGVMVLQGRPLENGGVWMQGPAANGWTQWTAPGIATGPGQAAEPHPRAQLLWLLFALIDADGDRAISLDELQMATERIFRALDSNNDGRVSPDEIAGRLR
jgi:hypothetical protein